MGESARGIGKHPPPKTTILKVKTLEFFRNKKIPQPLSEKPTGWSPGHFVKPQINLTTFSETTLLRSLRMFANILFYLFGISLVLQFLVAQDPQIFSPMLLFLPETNALHFRQKRTQCF